MKCPKCGREVKEEEEDKTTVIYECECGWWAEGLAERSKE